jgi:hypothetical protein
MKGSDSLCIAQQIAQYVKYSAGWATIPGVNGGRAQLIASCELAGAKLCY